MRSPICRRRRRDSARPSARFTKAPSRAPGSYYRELTALLQGDAREILGDIWHISPMSHPKRVQKVDRQAEKRAIEVARYVLPVAAATTMVHTLSGIVLHRLWRMAAASDTPTEARAVIGEMVARVREIDPQFFDRFDNAPMEQEEMPEWSHAAIDSRRERRRSGSFAREFDARLGGPRLAAHGFFAARAARRCRSLSRRAGPYRKRVLRTTKRSTGCSIPRAIPIAWRRSTSACTRRSCARCNTPISRSRKKSATPRTARTSAIAWCPARARCLR